MLPDHSAPACEGGSLTCAVKLERAATCAQLDLLTFENEAVCRRKCFSRFVSHRSHHQLPCRYQLQHHQNSHCHRQQHLFHNHHRNHRAVMTTVYVVRPIVILRILMISMLRLHPPNHFGFECHHQHNSSGNGQDKTSSNFNSRTAQMHSSAG